jgi:SAM-dependent methyltransferase
LPIAPPQPVFDVGADRAAAGDRGILLEFRHGLGDLVQLSIVLKHLRQQNPVAPIDVVCADEKAMSHSGIERLRFGFHSPRYLQGGWDQVIHLDFCEFGGEVEGFPHTKPLRCLMEELHIQPRIELFSYSLVVGDDAKKRARAWLEKITGATALEGERFPVVMVHYQGCSSRMHKDLPHEAIAPLCSAARLRGRTVAVLDLERNSPIVDQATVFSPLNGNPVWQRPGIADPETMAAMISMVELFVGIDSGPLHIAGAVDTPAIGVWTHHHPVRYFDLASNVLHLVPTGHRRLAGGERAWKSFEQLYRYEIYGCLKGALIEQLDKALKGDRVPAKPRSDALPGLNALGFTEDYYTEHVNAGLDYCGHGDWQREYATWLADVFGWRGQRVLDVGCACGSILRGLGHVGVIVEGVDVSEFMVERGRRKWPDQAKLMHVGDAINLHMFGDASWDGLHSAQVAEHWRPELVWHILRELLRVTRPGGLFFAAFDTSELFERNSRKMEDEDKTHVCIRPMQWWVEQFQNAGWHVASDAWRGPLNEHPGSFLKRYDWDWIVATRPKIEVQ